MSSPKRFAKIGRCKLHSTATICDGAIIGKLFRPFLDGTRERGKTTVVKAKAYIGYNSVVGTGSIVGRGAILDDFTILESRVAIGDNSLLIYRAQICNDAFIGNACVIGGLIGERTKVGNRCRVFGNIVHLQHEPHKGWDDDVLELAPVIHDDAFVGFGAVVAGSLTIGRKAYICSGAIVTKNVPPKHIAHGVNQFVRFSRWSGRLKRSAFFRD